MATVPSEAEALANGSALYVFSCLPGEIPSDKISHWTQSDNNSEMRHNILTFVFTNIFMLQTKIIIYGNIFFLILEKP